MDFGDRALPVMRGQLDIWLAQETCHSGAEWQLGLFVKIEGFVERDALEWAIGRVVQEAEPVRPPFQSRTARCSKARSTTRMSRWTSLT